MYHPTKEHKSAVHTSPSMESGVAKCHLQCFLLKLGLQLSNGKDDAAGNKFTGLHYSPEMFSKCTKRI